jgi:hypothetical protein
MLDKARMHRFDIGEASRQRLCNGPRHERDQKARKHDLSASGNASDSFHHQHRDCRGNDTPKDRVVLWRRAGRPVAAVEHSRSRESMNYLTVRRDAGSRSRSRGEPRAGFARRACAGGLPLVSVAD